MTSVSSFTYTLVTCISCLLQGITAQSPFTAWFSGDTTNGLGDFENGPSLGTCGGPTPIAIEVRKVGSTKSVCRSTQYLEVGPSWGLKCFNWAQPDKTCLDYEVRYWFGNSKVFNEDRPLLKASRGDFEVLARHEACGLPFQIGFRPAGSGPTYTATENVSMGPSRGFRCFHEDQADGCCEDYEIRYECPAGSTPGDGTLNSANGTRPTPIPGPISGLGIGIVPQQISLADSIATQTGK